jgi:hypothetical protein
LVARLPKSSDDEQSGRERHWITEQVLGTGIRRFDASAANVRGTLETVELGVGVGLPTLADADPGPRIALEGRRELGALDTALGLTAVQGLLLRGLRRVFPVARSVFASACRLAVPGERHRYLRW